ncbi:MAG: hypothetical protein ABSF64_00195 [Bryobacteraceae bacterium]
MKALVFLLCALGAGAFAQQVELPLASFTGTVREINSTMLRLARQDQDDLDVSLTHNTHYYSGSRKIKRETIKPGDRLSVETKLDLYLKPEAVNVRVMPPEKP